MSKLLAKIYAIILIPAVKLNQWKRFMGYLPDEWYWADLYCDRQGFTVIERRGAVAWFIRLRFGNRSIRPELGYKT